MLWCAGMSRMDFFVLPECLMTAHCLLVNLCSGLREWFNLPKQFVKRRVSTCSVCFFWVWPVWWHWGLSFQCCSAWLDFQAHSLQNEYFNSTVSSSLATWISMCSAWGQISVSSLVSDQTGVPRCWLLGGCGTPVITPTCFFKVVFIHMHLITMTHL